jgi:CBS domain-containing protein
MFRVQDVMTAKVRTCRLSDNLSDVAQAMLERGCGAIPIVDDDSRIAGIVTDRDLLMACLMHGRALHETRVEGACARAVVCCHATDALEWAEELMRANRVRRLPVIDERRRVVGILSLSDLARHIEVVATHAGSSLSPRQIALVLLATSAERGPACLDDSRRALTVSSTAPTARPADDGREVFPAFLPPDGDVFFSARTELDELTSGQPQDNPRTHRLLRGV